MNALALTPRHTPVELRAFTLVQPRFLLTFSAKAPVGTLTDFAEHCMAIGQNIRKNTVVVFERSMFEGCIQLYATPILEDVSGLRAGVDFWVALRYKHSVAYSSYTDPGVTAFLERKAGMSLHQSEGIEQLEQLMLYMPGGAAKVGEENSLLEVLHKAGFKKANTKILVQGTGLQGKFGHQRLARIKALANLVSLYKNLEIHDPYLDDEVELNARGIHLTLNFSGNYAVVLNLSDAPVYKFYNEEFYRGICAKEPVIIDAC